MDRNLAAKKVNFLIINLGNDFFFEWMFNFYSFTTQKRSLSSDKKAIAASKLKQAKRKSDSRRSSKSRSRSSSRTRNQVTSKSSTLGAKVYIKVFFFALLVFIFLLGQYLLIRS